MAADPTCAGVPRGDLSLVQRWMGATAGKWSLPILDRLAAGGCRYNRLLDGLEPVSAKVLTQTLRRLEADGLIACERVGTYGRRYRLTDCGREVRARLATLRQLAGEMVPAQAAVPDVESGGR